jgi:hypothetical protein
MAAHRVRQRQAPARLPLRGWTVLNERGHMIGASVVSS